MAGSAAVPMISIEGVNKHFGDLHVLKDINLEICLLYTSPSPRD